MISSNFANDKNHCNDRNTTHWNRQQYQVSKAEKILSSVDKIQNGLNKLTKLSQDSILLQANEKQE